MNIELDFFALEQRAAALLTSSAEPQETRSTTQKNADFIRDYATPTPSMKPFNPELCPLVVVNRPEYFNGQRWQTLEAYEDNHVTQERRVFKLRVYLTASGKPSRTRAHTLEVFTAYGYDDTRRNWGRDGNESRHTEAPFSEAVALMGTINKLAGKFDQYRGTATYYRSGKQ